MRGEPHQRVVYFATARELGCVKLGYCHDIGGRLKSLQAWSPCPLVFEAVVPGARCVEQWFLLRYRATRIHGEWCRIADAIEVDMECNRAGRLVERMPVEPPDDGRSIPGELLRHYREKLFRLTVEDMAAACDLLPSTWRQREAGAGITSAVIGRLASAAVERGVDLTVARILDDAALIYGARA